VPEWSAIDAISSLAGRFHGHAGRSKVICAGRSRGIAARCIPENTYRTTLVVDAIVVLPDHLHAIMTLPPDDSDFSDRWRRIKGIFTRSVVAAGVPISREHRGEYALWQKRFWEHTIRNDRDLERCADYIHFNPVKHRLVASPSDWPFSSPHRYLRVGILTQDWGGDGHIRDSRETKP
jgi:putative transposase